MIKINNKQRVLVTGGSGFMGTHLVQTFIDSDVMVANADINQPLCTNHSRHWTNINLLSFNSVYNFFNHFQPTHVIHLAARTDLNESMHLEGYAANTLGVKHILEAISKTPSVRRAIITSSMLVCRLGYIPSSPVHYAPNTLYGESKVITEKITREMDPPCVWTLIRPTTIWGPYHERMKTEFFAVLEKGFYLHPGNKSCLKSYGYVGNAIFQIRKLLEAPPELVHKKTFYISDPPINLKDWVDEFSKKLIGKKITVIPLWLMCSGALFGDLMVRLGIKRFPLTTFRLKNIITENVVDIRPIMSIAGKLPYSVSDGIDRTVSWLNQRL